MEIAISTASITITETQMAFPEATPSFSAFLPGLPTPPPFTDSSTPKSERIVYYYFVTAVENPIPKGSMAVISYILAPTPSDMTYSPDTTANLKAALEFVLNDSRNGWISSNLIISNVTFSNGNADVVLKGEYYGVGDVALVAASMQILMTVFADASVQTASVTLNGDTIGNMGVSNSIYAKPANYVFARGEIETFMNEHAYVLP